MRFLLVFFTAILSCLAYSALADISPSFPPVSTTLVKMPDGQKVRFLDSASEMYPVIMPDGVRITYLKKPSKKQFLKTYQSYVTLSRGMEKSIITNEKVRSLWGKIGAANNDIRLLTNYQGITTAEQLGVFHQNLLQLELDTSELVMQIASVCLNYLETHREGIEHENLITPDDTVMCHRFILTKSPLNSSPFKEAYKEHFIEVSNFTRKVIFEDLSKADFEDKLKGSMDKLTEANLSLIDSQFYEPAKQQVLRVSSKRLASQQEEEQRAAKRSELLKMGLSMMANGTFDGKPRRELEEKPFTCSVGTYPWTDEWGNKICKSFTDGETRSVQVKDGDCPIGSHPSMDKWGNKTCDSFTKKETYYDTSKGCPIGMHPSVDKWGNPACTPF
ncbi:MAG TPA: hypothetical protein VHP58_00010 [Alphaproteobacteria bacterium]|nr:hypothetical protein [Alphaproteobacteria bacterium]